MTSQAPDVAQGSTKHRGLGKTVLITGASGGIGYELTRLFARDGYDLVLVARSKDKLKAVADELERHHGSQVRVLPKDLSRVQAPSELASELDAESVRIDVLVKNAGFGIYGPFTGSAVTPHVPLLCEFTEWVAWQDLPPLLLVASRNSLGSLGQSSDHGP
jgi:NAD(P)-dependent dehydrogenase (short-subunit alcohol dehydrogenase family)